MVEEVTIELEEPSSDSEADGETSPRQRRKKHDSVQKGKTSSTKQLTPGTKPVATSLTPEQTIWAEFYKKEKAKAPKLNVKQPPDFTLVYDDTVAGLDKVVLTDEELDEGICQWKHTLIGMVAGTEVTR